MPLTIAAKQLTSCELNDAIVKASVIIHRGKFKTGNSKNYQSGKVACLAGLECTGARLATWLCQ